MSIFKVKYWWSTDSLHTKETVSGSQNAYSLKVDRFNSHSDSDCILLAEESTIKVFKPNIEQENSHTLLESELEDVILQIETGKFVSEIADRQIIVLHARSYSIYQLLKQEGHTNAGEQNKLEPLVRHAFTRKADSLTCGPFGNIKTRDFICIQGLDGSLSFFDQDTFLFLCIFNDVIIPGPISYIANCDAFVLCKSTWVLEIYSYQQLREFSELSLRQNKQNVPQWTYSACEEITQIQVIQTSSNFSSIIALGERHLCCFQDNGLMKFMIKFDYMPMCFNSYLIGWYYEPTARMLVMVASDDCKLYVYENTTLLWSCDLLHPVISIARCFLKNLPGGIVSLSNTGIVNVGYLGTEPDLNGNARAMINESIDPEQIQAELDEVESAFQKLLDDKNEADTSFSLVERTINIKADVGKPVQNLFQEFSKGDEALHLLMCPIIVMITCDDPKIIQNVQISYVCCFPFACSESAISLDRMNGTEIIETQVFLTSHCDISDTRVVIMFTITDSVGKIVVLSRDVLLPISLYCTPIEIIPENQYMLSVRTNQPIVEFTRIFTDFNGEDLSGNTITFGYRSTKNTITLKIRDDHYIIEANNFTEITSVLDHFLVKLIDHHRRMSTKDFRFDFQYDKEFKKQLLHSFLKSIEIHAKERIKLKGFEDELMTLHGQFTLIQKKLLVQYGSLPPGDCESLEFLMKDTHQRLVSTVQEIVKCKDTVCNLGSTLSTVGRLILCILKQVTHDNLKMKLIEEMMSVNSLYEDYQEWEEAAVQGVFYILNTLLKKSDKDKEKLAPVTEQDALSQINVKRCLKQTKVILEMMFDDASAEDQDGRVARTEELVEVL
ncbi:protein PTHB1 [Bombyx mandarina]|uniref:Protein PTHB1 n=1 Tax=Bombyx mandarina TaxID=7092 RepID=A0A6J2JLR1_BOMMA|nr:protein PTHB1 [Bombyx mandarina]